MCAAPSAAPSLHRRRRRLRRSLACTLQPLLPWVPLSRRHDCEEVFLIQRGVGTLRYRAPDGSLADLRFARNDTLLIPPNMMHQVRGRWVTCFHHHPAQHGAPGEGSVGDLLPSLD